ncbi:MAG: ABC transporter substrate-binding protein [Alphaproteobacteria bacterium]|nr:ABC transporter substrate-binding protein [Alphaproteobacteria bacterium]
MKFVFRAFTLTALLLLALPMAANAQQTCPIKLGGILPITGSLASIGKPISDAAQMAVDDINKAGGIKGCQVEFILRDDQTQTPVALDAAKFLIEVQRVPAIIGPVPSAAAIPMASTFAVQSKVVLSTCCATSPTLTTLAQEGKSGGYFFRTLPTTKTQAYSLARIAIEAGYRRTSVVWANNDNGRFTFSDFQKAFEKLGGKVAADASFNENQPSYRAEVQKALGGNPDSVLFIAFPQDGATVVREWLQLGGTQNMLVINGLRSEEFIKAVGPRFLQKMIGYDVAQVKGPSVDAFNAAWNTKFGRAPATPGLHSTYDSVMVVALAMQLAKEVNGTEIRDNMRKALTLNGEVVFPGSDGFKKASDLIKAGKAIRYVGATGPLQYDQYGDVSAPTMQWKIDADGKIVEGGTRTLDQVQELFKQVDG